MKPVAIVLNGTSSAGKSSIARALQRLAPRPVLHASLDTFTDMFAWPAIPEEQRRDCHRVGVANFHAALPILAGGGYPLVVDHVFEWPEWYAACRAALAAQPACFVGVRCPLALAEERERARGDRRIGLARWQYERVHADKPYDLEVDTAASSPEECAVRILEHVGR